MKTFAEYVAIYLETDFKYMGDDVEVWRKDCFDYDQLIHIIYDELRQTMIEDIDYRNDGITESDLDYAESRLSYHTTRPSDLIYGMIEFRLAAELGI